MATTNILELLLFNPFYAYFGVTGIIVLCLLFSRAVRHAWLFLIILQILMLAEYLTLGGDYFWHVLLLAAGASITVLVGTRKL